MEGKKLPTLKKENTITKTKSKPAKLNKSIREYLDKAIDDIVKDTERREKVDKQYEELKCNLKTYMLNKYSPDDLEVLNKFKLTNTSLGETIRYIDGCGMCIRVSDPKEPYFFDKNLLGRENKRKNFLHILFDKPVTSPFIKGYDSYEDGLGVIQDKQLIADIEHIKSRYSEIRADEEIKAASYRKVLSVAKTINELQEVWLDVGTYFFKYIKEHNLEAKVDQKIKDVVKEDSSKRI